MEYIFTAIDKKSLLYITRTNLEKRMSHVRTYYINYDNQDNPINKSIRQQMIRNID